MTTEATITHLKGHLSALRDLVKSGQTLVVTDHGVPVAQITPYTMPPDTQSLRGLVRQGLLRPPKVRLNLRELHSELAPDPDDLGIRLLLDERQTGR